MSDSGAKTYKEKYQEITSGWSNWIFKNDKIEAIAKIRADICARCDSNKANVCKECGCPLFAKTRSVKPTTECDLGKWGPYNENNES